MEAGNCRDCAGCAASPRQWRFGLHSQINTREETMSPDCALWRGSALAGFVAALLAGAPALAQQPAAPAGGGAAPAAAPVDRGSALYGRPDGEHAAKLAPVAPPPIPTPAD